MLITTIKSYCLLKKLCFSGREICNEGRDDISDLIPHFLAGHPEHDFILVL
jgi:hypothetical protein